MSDTVWIRLDLAGDLDDELLARTTGDLREELLELDVESVTRPPGGPPPRGAKPGEVLAAGALLLAVAPSVVEGLMTVLASWLSRQPASLTMEIDGQRIEGTFTRAQRDKLVAAYLARVTGSDDRA